MKKKWVDFRAVFLLIIIMLMAGCSNTASDSPISENQTENIGITDSNEGEVCAESDTKSDANGDGNNSEGNTEIITLETLPDYYGSAYVEINGNIPYFTEDEITTDAFEFYSELDEYGRCGVAFANICQELMPTEPRGEIGSIRPTGWHTVKYDGIDGNYLYNRCHLIAYALAGENANEENLITGTRYLNVEGMLPFENSVASYVDETDNHVLYRVTPVFEEDNLVASGVLMEAMSVEDEGEGILFCVYCYNVQPGIEIDYATGESWVAEDTSETQENLKEKSDIDGVLENSDVVNEADDSTDVHTYILNTNTKKFHYPDCSAVDRMSEKNKQEYTGTRDEVISQGYDSCGLCNP